MTLDLDRTFVAKLDRLGVHIDVADGNTVSFKNVPAHAKRFSKPRTNLLMQRPRPGLPFIVGVDEDLEYVGPDPTLSRLFAAGVRQRGWRVLRLDATTNGAFQHVVERALRVVGFDGVEPAVEVPAASTAPSTGSGQALSTGLLATGVRLTAESGERHVTIGRRDETDVVAASVLQWQVRLPVIVGDPGVGKTNLLNAVARRIAEVRPSIELIRIDLAELFAGTLFDAERENVLSALLKEAARPGLVLCLEGIELVRLAMPEGPRVLDAAIEKGTRIIGTAPRDAVAMLQSLPLSRWLHVIELDELNRDDAVEVTRLLSAQLAQHHHVTIADSVVGATVDRAADLQGYFPAKAIALLDAAATRAVLSGDTAVEVVHVYLAAAGFVDMVDMKDMKR